MTVGGPLAGVSGRGQESSTNDLRRFRSRNPSWSGQMTNSSHLLAIAAAFGLTAPVSAAPTNAVTSFKPSSPRTFLCDDARTISVITRGQDAVVKVGRREYSLKRKPFSLGERFTSPAATLIIDSGFAAFVSRREGSLQGCFASTHEAQL